MYTYIYIHIYSVFKNSSKVYMKLLPRFVNYTNNTWSSVVLFPLIGRIKVVVCIKTGILWDEFIVFIQ